MCAGLIMEVNVVDLRSRKEVILSVTGIWRRAVRRCRWREIQELNTWGLIGYVTDFGNRKLSKWLEEEGEAWGT